MRAIIFDLDDTLYPREQYVQSGLSAVARHVAAERRCGFEHAQRVLSGAHRESPGREFQALSARLGLPASHIDIWVAVFRAHTPVLALADDARHTLRQLRQEGFALAILTNGLPSVQAHKIAALGLEAHVDHVVYAEEHAPAGKPHASAFGDVLRRLGATAAECVMVGDDVRCDIEGARAAGLRAIRLDRYRDTRAAACAADAVAAGLDEIPRLAASLLPLEAVHAA